MRFEIYKYFLNFTIYYVHSILFIDSSHLNILKKVSNHIRQLKDWAKINKRKKENRMMVIIKKFSGYAIILSFFLPLASNLNTLLKTLFGRYFALFTI